MVKGATSYAFTQLDGHGRPARWDPCSEVPIVVNWSGAPQGAKHDLIEALAVLRRNSGLRLTLKGVTHQKPTGDWGTRALAGRTGWPPVLVAWSRPNGRSLSEGASASTTTVVMPSPAGGLVYVSGQVILNLEQTSLYEPGFGSGMSLGALLEHELGHLVGLAHVSDRSQIMFDTMGGAPTLGTGDRAGLRRLGQGSCLSKPAP